MIDAIWYWILIGLFSIILLIWLGFAIYRGVRFQTIQAFAYVFLILALSFTLGEYSPIPYYQHISGSLTILGLFFILFGLICSQRRWEKVKGTKNHNSVRHLLIYGLVRQPIEFGTIILSFAIILISNSIISTVFSVLAVIAFFLASYEKDSYFSVTYGYPYRLYSDSVPRFNIIWGIIKSIRISSKAKEDKTKTEVVYE